MFGAVYAADGSSPEALLAVARDFSPRIEACSAREIVLDLDGLRRLFGDAKTIGDELRRTAADRGLRVRVAIAGTRTAARLLVHSRAGVTVVASGGEAAAVAPLPISDLEILRAADEGSEGPPVEMLRRWGLATLGDFAALPPDGVAARLGQSGVAWQRLACGEDPRPLVPAVPEERFEQSLDLEWPIDGLEPLSFVLSRLLEPLEAHLARRDRGAAVLHVRLHLADRSVHARALQLPTPIRDARALRTLALLDLDAHPPSAAIDRVVVAVDPTPGRIVQFSLLTRPLPTPECLSTLMARLAALMGEGRCGSPAGTNTWAPGAFAMTAFAPRDATIQPSTAADASPAPVPAVALRRFRCPVPVRVRVDDGRPTHVTTDRRGLAGGRIETSAGPWRTSGDWWRGGWDRDEWDVTLRGGMTYRLFRTRSADQWAIDGVVD